MVLPKQVNPESIIIVSPRCFEDEKYIADQLLQGRVVVVDFKYLDTSIKQRVVAFLEGMLFGIDGKLVVMRDDLILLLPEGALHEERKELKPVIRFPEKKYI